MNNLIATNDEQSLIEFISQRSDQLFENQNVLKKNDKTLLKSSQNYY